MLQLYTIFWTHSKGFDILGFLKENSKILYYATAVSINLEIVGLGLLIEGFL